MLSYVRSLFGLTSAVCAILSPVCVVHWLVRLSTLPKSVIASVSFLNPVFLPVSQAIDVAIPPSVHQFFGQQSAIGQGVLSLCLTITVIVTAFIAKMIQVVETRSKVHQNYAQHQHMVRENLARRIQEQSVKQQANTLVLFIRHEDSLPTPIALERCKQAKCEVLFQSEEKSVLRFNSLEDGLAAIRQSALWVKTRMTQLRPMDAPPKYRFVLHAIEPQDSAQSAAAWCESLEKFCKNNHLVCTQSVNDVVQVKKLPLDLTSLGVYDLANSSEQQELFNLNL
jgi:hypothetical protein